MAKKKKSERKRKKKWKINHEGKEIEMPKKWGRESELREKERRQTDRQ